MTAGPLSGLPVPEMSLSALVIPHLGVVEKERKRELGKERGMEDKVIEPTCSHRWSRFCGIYKRSFFCFVGRSLGMLDICLHVRRCVAIVMKREEYMKNLFHRQGLELQHRTKMKLARTLSEEKNSAVGGVKAMWDTKKICHINHLVVRKCIVGLSSSCGKRNIAYG